jgi:integrase
MSAPSSVRVPAYRHYKPKDLAVVRLNGRDHYLGKFDSPASWRKYHELIASFLSNTPSELTSSIAPAPKQAIAMKELVLKYFEFVEGYYVKDGKPTSEVECIRYALRRVLKLYGDIPAAEFGPLALKEVREEFIRDGQARTTVNSNISRVRRMFRWGTENELLPVAIYQALATVTGLRRGRTVAADARPVLPVAQEAINKVMPRLPGPIQAMVQLQLLTGCRPAEICQMRPIDIDRTGEVWCYRPQSHKTAHHGVERRIFLGPKAQAILTPWLTRNPQEYCFSPAEFRRQQDARRRAGRKSPMTPSQAKRRPKSQPRRIPGDRYKPCSYRISIARACRKVKIPVWKPNQLRHTRATELRRLYGLDAAQVVLGHSEANVTQIYAEKNFSQAERLMLETG